MTIVTIKSLQWQVVKGAKISINKAWEPNLAAAFCGQPHKQASAQGHNDNSYNIAKAVAGGQIKLPSLSIFPYCAKHKRNKT